MSCAILLYLAWSFYTMSCAILLGLTWSFYAMCCALNKWVPTPRLYRSFSSMQWKWNWNWTWNCLVLRLYPWTLLCLVWSLYIRRKRHHILTSIREGQIILFLFVRSIRLKVGQIPSLVHQEYASAFRVAHHHLTLIGPPLPPGHNDHPPAMPPTSWGRSPAMPPTSWGRYLDARPPAVRWWRILTVRLLFARHLHSYIPDSHCCLRVHLLALWRHFGRRLCHFQVESLME